MDEEKINNNSDSDFAGKKIFFLYPTASVKNQIVTELVQHEFEVYVAKDHVKLTQVLKKYTESVVFINIDEKMPAQEWEKWISTILTTEPTVRLGIFSTNNDEEFKEKFTKNNRIKCGYFRLKVDMSKTGEKILELVTAMNVKGRRKYLRATTEREANATINIPSGGEFINGDIRDISVIGVSCVFKNDPGLTKNAHLKDIQIKMQSMLIKVESVVFGSRDDNGQKIYVMLFTQKVDTEVKIKIRKYIQQNMQGKMDSEIN